MLNATSTLYKCDEVVQLEEKKEEIVLSLQEANHLLESTSLSNNSTGSREVQQVCKFIAITICGPCLYLQLMKLIWEFRTFMGSYEGLYCHNFPPILHVLGLFGRAACGLLKVSLDSDALLKSAFTFK